MPLIIHVLKSLDSALIDNEDIMTTIEKLTQANEELMKQCRKEIEEVSTNIHKMCSVCISFVFD